MNEGFRQLWLNERFVAFIVGTAIAAYVLVWNIRFKMKYHSDSYYETVENALKVGNTRQAIELLGQQRRRGRVDLNYHFYFGWALDELKHCYRAALHRRTFAEQCADDEKANAYFNVASSLMCANRYRWARLYFKRSLLFDPKNWETRFWLTVTYVDQRLPRFKKADELLRDIEQSGWDVERVTGLRRVIDQRRS